MWEPADIQSGVESAKEIQQQLYNSKRCRQIIKHILDLSLTLSSVSIPLFASSSSTHSFTHSLQPNKEFSSSSHFVSPVQLLFNPLYPAPVVTPTKLSLLPSPQITRPGLLHLQRTTTSAKVSQHKKNCANCVLSIKSERKKRKESQETEDKTTQNRKAICFFDYLHHLLTLVKRREKTRRKWSELSF